MGGGGGGGLLLTKKLLPNAVFNSVNIYGIWGQLLQTLLPWGLEILFKKPNPQPIPCLAGWWAYELYHIVPIRSPGLTQ